MSEQIPSEQSAKDARALTVEQQVWLAAWCAVAGCFNSNSDAATQWADKCLKKFKERWQ